MIENLLLRLRYVLRRADARACSLLQALYQLLPPPILRETLRCTSDRRQWPRMAAAFLGRSERELMEAVAVRLQYPFELQISSTDLIAWLLEQGDLADRMFSAGAFLGHTELGEVVVACIDPAELREVTRDGLPSHRVVLTTYSTVISQFQRFEAARTERLDKAQARENSALDEMAREALRLMINEVEPFDIRTVDVFVNDERPRYQFVMQDGRRGVGYFAAMVAPALKRVLVAADRGTIEFITGIGRTELQVAQVGSEPLWRLHWSIIKEEVAEPVSERRLLDTPRPFLPAPADSSSPITLGQLSEVVKNSDGAPSSEDSVSRRLVLIVDDNAMFARILQKFLEKAGFATVVARNGDEALSLLRNSGLRPVVVVTDLHMPIMNGRDLIAVLRRDAQFASTPVVLLTSDEDVEAEIQLLSTGADAFLQKSKDPRVLCSHVARLADQRDTRRAA
jgi:CheY-like chemotaxis protein